MVEIMMPSTMSSQSWNCAPLNLPCGMGGQHSKGQSPGSWGASHAWPAGEDAWATEDWVHTPQAATPMTCSGPWIFPVGEPAGEETSPTEAPFASLGLPQEEVAPVGMRMQLQALQMEDPGSVLITRRLHRLGFNSAEKLKQHFENYGVVREVLVPHSRVKASPGRRARTRPAAIGFVIMESAEAAYAALAEGQEHMVEGIQINVQAFERRQNSDSDGEAEKNSQSGGSNTPSTVDTVPKEEDGSESGSPKGRRWADISDDDTDDTFTKSPKEVHSTPQGSDEDTHVGESTPKGPRWADLSEEFQGITTPVKNSRRVKNMKIHDLQEQVQMKDGTHGYAQQGGDSPSRGRQQGRGRAPRGRA